jgi:DNA polymerase-3 subunit beta
MKFSVSSSALLKHLSYINGVIVNKPVMPILANFLFEIADGVMTATASDLQNTMSTQLSVDAKEDINICVPARLLLDTLRNMPEQAISLNIELESFSIELTSEFGIYKLAGENAIDFPRLNKLAKADSIQIPCNVLQKAVSYTLFCTSTDTMRPAMTGVLMQINETRTTFVATDGHRLVRYYRDDIYSADALGNFILPKKALMLLKATLPDDGTMVDLQYNAANAFFNYGDIRLVCRLIEERFPDYEAVIPASNHFTLTLQRLELLNSLKRIVVYSPSSHQVRFKMSDTDLNISAENLEFSNEANEDLQVEYEGDPLEIGFTATYMIEMLNNLEANILDIELMAANKPGILIPKNQDENENVLMLIMPVMLTNYI